MKLPSGTQPPGFEPCDSASVARLLAAQPYPPLSELYGVDFVKTKQAAYYVLTQPQTLLRWASGFTVAPTGLLPRRVGRRLLWSVKDLKALMGVPE